MLETFYICIYAYYIYSCLYIEVITSPTEMAILCMYSRVYMYIYDYTHMYVCIKQELKFIALLQC